MTRFLKATILIALSMYWPTLHAVPEPPDFKAKSYILLDYNSGQVLAARKPDMRIEPASITKLMTAYIVFSELQAGNVTLDDEVHISEKAWRMGGSKMFVRVGTKVRLEDLLRGMIIQSGNDATVALAEYLAGGEDTFAEVMNQYAANLGMTGSNFTNATGWPGKNHYSTARDIAVLSRAIVRNFPEYYSYYSEKEFTWNKIKQHNRNRLLWREDGVDGLKTGHTESAGYCLVTSALRDKMRLIAVVIGTDSDKARTKASQALLNYGFRFYESHDLFQAGVAVEQSKVYKGDVGEVPIGFLHALKVATPRGRRDGLSLKAEVQKAIIAPIEKGEQLGMLKITLDGQVIHTEPLVALKSVAEGAWWQRWIDEALLLIAE